jgi:hypothetical protein
LGGSAPQGSIAEFFLQGLVVFVLSVTPGVIHLSMSKDDTQTVKVFKNAWFCRFSRRERISDSVLRKAVADLEQGRVDADLGGSVIKQRIARPGQGKSGGYRTIIVFRKGDRAFFVYGFAKSKRENLDPAETEAFKEAAKELLALSDEQISQLIDKGGLTEVEP